MPTRPAAEAARGSRTAASAGGARAFHDDLLDLERERERAFDGLLGDDDDVVDELAHDLAGERARRRVTAMPSAIVGPPSPGGCMPERGRHPG